MFGRMSVDKYLSRLDGEATQPGTPLTPGTAAVFDKMRAERAAEAASVSPEGLGSTSNTVLLRLANPDVDGSRGSILRQLSGPGGEHAPLSTAGAPALRQHPAAPSCGAQRPLRCASTMRRPRLPAPACACPRAPAATCHAARPPQAALSALARCPPSCRLAPQVRCPAWRR
jgi:hypothetical protein